MERLPVAFEGRPAYVIHFESSFDGLREALQQESIPISGRKICIVTDETVAGLYLDKLKELLSDTAGELYHFSFIPGEEHKNLDALSGLYAYLIEHHFDRSDLLMALGGGVVGDMTGYAAASYLRGIDFIQLPTTLLAQCDSSIGGKTAVDFQGYKNMIGAFYMPKSVYMNMATLNTLSDRQFLSGFAEVMKHGLIRDRSYYDWLLEKKELILKRDLPTLIRMIERSCEIKKEVVEKDPKEKGERALLNFGHSIGHAIEKASDFQLLHGECVAIGCVAAAFLSMKKGLLGASDYEKIREGIASFGMPVCAKGLDHNEVLAFTHSDKKRQGKSIRFILLNSIGEAFIDTSLRDGDLLSAIGEVCP